MKAFIPHLKLRSVKLPTDQQFSPLRNSAVLGNRNYSSFARISLIRAFVPPSSFSLFKTSSSIPKSFRQFVSEQRESVAVVKYGNETLRIPIGSKPYAYKFEHLLADAKRYFNLPDEKSARYSLASLEGDTKWPLASSVVQIFMDIANQVDGDANEPLEIHMQLLISEKVDAPSISEAFMQIPKKNETNNSQQPKYRNYQEEQIEKKTRESLILLGPRLEKFCDSEWLKKEMAMTPISIPAERKLSTLLYEFAMELKAGIEKKFRTSLHILRLGSPDIADEEFYQRIFPYFISFVNTQLAQSDKNIDAPTNMQNPHHWYPIARRIKRKIVMHLGPTNSGKTHFALRKMAESASGVYCGPLRLLAHEIYEKLTDKGVACNLLTGQQQITMAGAMHTSCTVEMADVNRKVKIAVIDEIQMIADSERGWAWTRAVLGIPAEEIHLCGDPISQDVVERLAKITGEEVEVIKYERLSPLVPMDRPFLNYQSKLQKGDCVISFSRKQIYGIKAKIEESSNVKCCVVYGSLPPEGRKQQADLFNDPDSKYDVLVASDAIGMGLNLNIRRIIFAGMKKATSDGDMRFVTSPEIRQIAGRAGRFSGSFPKGEAYATNPDEAKLLVQAFQEEPVAIEKAGIFPTFEHLALFAAKKRGIMFSVLLDQFALATRVDTDYFLCNYTTMSEIAKCIEHLPMILKDRYNFCTAPVSKASPLALKCILKWAVAFTSEERVPLELDVGSGKEDTKVRISELEEIHNCCDIYLWLAMRYPSEFYQMTAAYRVKKQCNEEIDALLEKLGLMNKYRGRQKELKASGFQGRPIRDYNRPRRDDRFFKDELKSEDAQDEVVVQVAEDSDSSRNIVTRQDRKEQKKAEIKQANAKERQRMNEFLSSFL